MSRLEIRDFGSLPAYVGRYQSTLTLTKDRHGPCATVVIRHSKCKLPRYLPNLRKQTTFPQYVRCQYLAYTVDIAYHATLCLLIHPVSDHIGVSIYL